jgi:glycosyltransferase involved in cell wall biosynthesis
MLTDAWVPAGSSLGFLRVGAVRRLAERYHADLDSAEVRDFTGSLVKHELEWRLQRKTGWELLMLRNQWFQEAVVSALERIDEGTVDQPVLFAHSYSARAAFAHAKQRGWTTVLGQIDPGEEHFAIVRRLSEAAPQYGPPPPGPPTGYFAAWREECALADHIVVNSGWSYAALIKAGVDHAKLTVIPLACEPLGMPTPEPKCYPEAFTPARPLRLLFVGSVSVVKGMPQLLDAMASLKGEPVRLRVVGEPAMTVPAEFRSGPAIEWVGSVPRSEMARHYQESDVLVFPSHSDGFGMVQIEAAAAALPIIASSHCGRVVQDGTTGMVLPEVSGAALAGAVRRLLARPALLPSFSAAAARQAHAGLDDLGAALAAVVR